MASIRENIQRVVIKCGTGILTRGIGELDTERIYHFCDQIADLRRRNIDVIVVSSGSIGLGMGTLGLNARPTENIPLLQACAAIGQSTLIGTWRKGLDRHKIRGAQVLLTHDAVRERERHINTRNMLDMLLSRGIVPIINENDSVSAEEIKFGDNDVLSALVASFTKADQLFILSTAPGLIDITGTGKVVPVVDEISNEIEGMAGTTASPTAVGGMISKITAAGIATRSGCGVFIGSGRLDHILSLWFDTPLNPPEGTFFVPHGDAIGSRKRWIAFFEKPKGKVTVDAGAREALVSKQSSLLAKGVTHVYGEFSINDVVEIIDSRGQPFARGISQFSHIHLQQIAGLSTTDIQSIFPRRRRLEVIHRDTMVVL